jgi:hypothetical protein
MTPSRVASTLGSATGVGRPAATPGEPAMTERISKTETVTETSAAPRETVEKD